MWKVFIRISYIIKDSWCVVIMVLPKETVRKEGSASTHCVSFHGALCKLVRESIGWSVTKSFLRQDRIPSLTGPYIDSSARSHRWIRRSGNTQDFYDPSQPGSGFIASSLLGRGTLLVDRGTSYDIFVNRIPFHEEINFRAVAFTYLYLSCKFVVI